MNNFIQLCAFRMRCHYERLTGPENIQNVAVVQLAAGAFCLLLEVYLYGYAGHDSHAALVLFLAVCATLAGIFGCFYHDRRCCIRLAYLSLCVSVLVASVLFFFTTYCLDFFSAVSNPQLYLSDETVAAADDFRFWLKCAVVMSIIIASLFTLAALCVVLSFTPNLEEEQPTWPLTKEESCSSAFPIL